MVCWRALSDIQPASGFSVLFSCLVALTPLPAAPATAFADSGPQIGWMVITLPNPEVTPDWREYAPPQCASNPDQCALDHRFWELWDFSAFAHAIDAAFATIAGDGNYYGVIPIVPLGDTATYWNNIRLLYDYAANHGLAFDPAIFPKWKWGAESCYLYLEGAPADCAIVPGTSTAVAYQKLLDLMDFVQDLGGGCPPDSNHRFALWYGWRPSSPGFDVLHTFWHTLPTTPCNHQQAYVTWLDTPFAPSGVVPEVAQLQAHVVNDHQLPFW